MPCPRHGDVLRGGRPCGAGIIAKTDTDLTIDSCYASGSATGFGTEGSVAGLVGRRSGGTLVISNSYSTARLQGNYVGNGLVGNGYNASMTIVDTQTIIDCFPKNIVNLAKRGNGSGTVSWDGDTPVATPDPGSVFIRWDNEIPEGEFNEITLYAVFGKAVASESDLRALPVKGFFKQTADITMTTGVAFTGLHNSPKFQGEYDGQGFEISDLTISGNNDYVALFRQTQGAVLRNVILKGGKVMGRTGVAPLVGWQYGGLVERCSADVEVEGTGDHAAGLVGRSSNYATIRESRALGSVKSNRYVGGLVSFTSGTAYTYDCYTLSDVTANSYAGGFISGADNTPVIHNCFAAGRVTSGTPVGGFYGRNDVGRTLITNNYWDKDASGLATSAYGTGLTTVGMRTMSNFGSWSDDVWLKTEGAYPELWAFAEEEDVVVVPASITGDRNLRIPYSWFESFPSLAEDFDADYTKAALMPTGKTAADGSPMYVWQDYVNGCDPTNPEDVFRATIEMVDGVPYIGWEPNLNTNETLRIYRIFGKADLADVGEQWGRVRSGHRFFKVTVEMPNGSAVSDEPGPVDVGGDWEPNLLCHLSFDDAGNDGLNVLKVRGGADAVVRTTIANAVTGLGAISVVTDSSILAGLEPGDGAVRIPLNTHIALPIPEKLLDREGHPYTLKMKVKFPYFGRYYALLNMPGTNDTDDMVFLNNDYNPVIALKIMEKSLGQSDNGKGGFTVNKWEDLTFQFGETNTRILLNGNEIYSQDLNLADSYADCYDAGGYFVISGDPDNQDNEMYWADVKVYDGIAGP